MAGAVSALFLLDIKGRVLIWRDYRGDVSAVQAERFFTKLIETEVFKHYFEELEEESLRDNFVVVYELLDEMMDFGYPQYTEAKILSEFIKTDAYRMEVTQRPPMAVTNAVSWRSEGIRYKKNEVAKGEASSGSGEARGGRRGLLKKREKHRERVRSIEKEDRRVTDASSPTSSINLSPPNLYVNLSSTPFLNLDPTPPSLDDPDLDPCRSIHWSTNTKDLIPYQEPGGNDEESFLFGGGAGGSGEAVVRAAKEVAARKVAKTLEPL
ncbi:hypothetical protein BHE74_00003674 [Ensete ventricosum]|uniref:AP complex mu/sigma subunit domain-containing protein n=1 Tax=Ensete ventricosum TaxID=4639 RepID=A0A426ZPY7_ENSVE|nr:hypothetical protein B296_00012919 [Ensete ventricosum]RWW87493.1 hypothetical protein BHE74_00003674 [Ensete ventricosum]RZR83064.1 hypothetical protein BHM03_00009612 [Ensete ventricosum]